MFDAVRLCDDCYATFGYGESALAIQVVIVSDFEFRRKADALVDNRASNLCVPADVDAVEEDRLVDLCIAVDPGVRPEDRPADLATGDDRAQADDTVHGVTTTLFGGKHELGWWIVG